MVSTSDYFKENYAAPSFIIGHSLGGSAALFVANQLDNIKAVVTIGSPSDPSDVKHLFQNSLEEMEANEKAKVLLEERPFTIEKEFVDDLLNHSLLKNVAQMRKPYLILQSPQDTFVDIKNAERLFVAAFHPKSFVSLDKADHLLTNPNDSTYVGNVIAEWASRYLEISDKSVVKSTSTVAASLSNQEKFTIEMKLGSHAFVADEPVNFGGNNFGPTPYDYLSGALAACKAMTVQMYARRKNWEVENVTVQINHSKQHLVDCEDCENNNAKIDTFNCEVELTGNLFDEQKQRLLEIS